MDLIKFIDDFDSSFGRNWDVYHAPAFLERSDRIDQKLERPQKGCTGTLGVEISSNRSSVLNKF